MVVRRFKYSRIKKIKDGETGVPQTMKLETLTSRRNSLGARSLKKVYVHKKDFVDDTPNDKDKLEDLK